MEHVLAKYVFVLQSTCQSTNDHLMALIVMVVFFFLMIRRPPRSTLFPYTNALPISGGETWMESVAFSPDGRRVLTVGRGATRSEEHTSELQSLRHLVCRLLLEKKIPRSRSTWRG